MPQISVHHLIKRRSSISKGSSHMRLSRRRILSRVWGQSVRTSDRQGVRRATSGRKFRSGSVIGEHLEQRIVLSDWGGDLLGSALNAVGVVTGPVIVQNSSNSTGSSSGHTSQLRTDVQALQTELASLAAKSGVTVADLTSLAADGQAFAQAGAGSTSRAWTRRSTSWPRRSLAGLRRRKRRPTSRRSSPARAYRRRRSRRRSPT